jgi:hypothetical protein
MSDLCRLIWCALIGPFRPRAALQAEILVLRHQLSTLIAGRRSGLPFCISIGLRDLWCAGWSGGICIAGQLAVVHSELIVSLVEHHRLPAVYPFRVFAAKGGLLAYGLDIPDMYRQAADYVGTRGACAPRQC